MVKFSKLAAIGTIVISIIALLAISIYGTYRILTIINTNSTIKAQFGESLLLSQTPGSVVKTTAELSQITRLLNSLSSDLKLGLHLLPTLGCCQPLLSEGYTWLLFLERIQEDIEISEELVDLYGQLAANTDVINKSLLSGNDPIQTSKNQNIIEISENFTVLKNNYLDSHQLSKKPKFVLMPKLLSPSISEIEALDSQLLHAINLGIQLSALFEDIQDLSSYSRTILDIYQNQNNESINTLSLVEDLQQKIQSIESRGFLIKSILDNNINPEIKETISEIDEFNETLNLLLSLISTAEKFIPVINEVDINNAKYNKTKIFYMLQILTNLAKYESELNESLDLLHQVDNQIKESQFPSIHMFSNTVNKGSDTLDLVKQISLTIPTVFNQKETITILILGLSSDELRASGGFVSSAWLGTLSKDNFNIRYHDIVLVDDWDLLDFYPKPPLALQEHMNAKIWLMRDVTWEPDFPTTAQTASDLYRIGQGISPDIIVTINQWAMLNIIESISEIYGPTKQDIITSRNFIDKIEIGTDTYGRAYVDLILQGFIEKALSTNSINDLLNIGSALYKSLKQNDIQIFFKNPLAQAKATQFKWTGEISDTQYDYLYIVDSNVGWSKVDRNIQRSINYQIDLRDIENIKSIVTLKYINHSGVGASPCNPQWILRGEGNYNSQKNSCYWNYWRLYAPQNSKHIFTTPTELSGQSVSVKTGSGLSGKDTFKKQSNYGKTEFSGLLSTEASDMTEMTIIYQLPTSILQKIDGTLKYNLIIQKQPGVPNREINLEIIIPDQYTILKSSPYPTNVSTNSVSFKDILTKDWLLELSLAPK